MSSLSKKTAYSTPAEKEQHRQELSSMLDIAGVEYRFVLYKGVPVSPFPGVKRRIQEYWRSFQPRQSDVWVCAYVKSGTHWVNEMSHMLLTADTTAPPPKEEFMLERVDCSAVEKLPSPRLLNTHLHFWQLPSQIVASGCKIIFVTRDVRDVVVSHFHHVSSRTPDNLALYRTTWEAHLDTFCKGLGQNGAWFDYVKGWHEGLLSSCPANVLRLSYESMLADHGGTLTRLAEFLLTPEQRARLPGDFLERARRLTEFEHMRAAHSAATAIQIYRRGKSGDWRDRFTELDLFNFRAAVFDPLDAGDRDLFLRCAGMSDWS